MWLRGIACIVLVLGCATPGWAAFRFALHSSIGVASAYVRLLDRDLPNDPFEDVQTREQLSNVLAFDNAYLHMDVRYRVSAVQLQRNENLDYLDHAVGIRMDANRWLRRFTENGRLTITADLKISPSLPPLGPDATSVPTTDEPEPDTTGPVPGALVGVGDVINLREDRSGYTMKYGLAYEDELSLFTGYRVGAVVRDTHYNSTLVEDRTSLRIETEHYTRLRAGRAGIGAHHARLLRGGDSNNQTYGVVASLSNTGYRSGWRIAPGVAYRTDQHTYGATLAASGFRRRRILTYSGHYKTDFELLHVGAATLDRAQRLGVAISPTRPTRYPRTVGAEAYLAGGTREISLGVGQSARLSDRIHAGVGYHRGYLRWVDEAGGVTHKRHSDTVRLSLDWQFL